MAHLARPGHGVAEPAGHGQTAHGRIKCRDEPGPPLELPGDILIFPPLATQVHDGDFHDAEAKLDAAGEGTVTCTQAALPTPITAALYDHVRTLWDGLGCHGMARADFIAAEDGLVAALEVNTIPGMSYESNFMTAADLLGLRHADVVIAMLREALTRPRYDAPLPVPTSPTSPCSTANKPDLGGCLPVVAGP